MAAGKVYLVGAGPGDPGLITVKGLERLRQAEVVVYDRLLNPQLLRQIPAAAELIYVGKRVGAHTITQDEINGLLVERAKAGKTVVRLKGGDPFVFGRGGEEILLLVEAGIPFEVVPGVTSAVAVPAYAGIPVTHRGYASSFAVITGHEDPTKPDSSIRWEHLATATDTQVFLMGMENLPLIVEQLIAHGRPASTPIALVRWGTWPQQETVEGTLADILQRLEGQPFGPPAVIVVGEVVRLREQLRWFDRRPLFGKTVLVTRSRDQASQLSQLLSDLGAKPVEAPAIEIREPEDYGPLDATLQRLRDYGWVVFTSANGVEAVWRRLKALGLDARDLAGVQLAAIGPATAQALESHGIFADLVPEQYLSQAVAEALAQRGLSGVPVLLPRTDLAGEDLAGALAQHGAQVDQVVAYRTVQAATLEPEVGELLRQGKVDFVTFASSSTVKHLIALLKGDISLLSKCATACIGPVTARTARELGLRVDIVAQEHTVPGLVRAVLERSSGGEEARWG
ncbi:MAG: uroporphyrinogen-III C-methyltransferase [Chloroflexi bacterium]|nr:uroporphyrinogen-III C-methyltransferase [Chloroflexota bacterium]